MNIAFNATIFRAMFKPYENKTVFTDELLNLFWDTATTFIGNQYFVCNGLSAKSQTLALNYMTAHLLYLSGIANTGQNTGVAVGASIDKISVTNMAPPADNQWQFWLNQSPYGQQLLALLSAKSAGGWYFGGYPTVHTIRR